MTTSPAIIYTGTDEAPALGATVPLRVRTSTAHPVDEAKRAVQKALEALRLRHALVAREALATTEHGGLMLGPAARAMMKPVTVETAAWPIAARLQATMETAYPILEPYLSTNHPKKRSPNP